MAVKVTLRDGSERVFDEANSFDANPDNGSLIVLRSVDAHSSKVLARFSDHLCAEYFQEKDRTLEPLEKISRKIDTIGTRLGRMSVDNSCEIQHEARRIYECVLAIRSNQRDSSNDKYVVLVSCIASFTIGVLSVLFYQAQ